MQWEAAAHMDFRHEWKYEINASDMIAVRQRLRAAARPDPHAVEGKYLIRSLYFDNLADKALLEKLDGVNQREKFRIRYYNGDASLIHLEKKSKLNGLGSGRPLVVELYSKMLSQGLRPKTIVDYEREPYIYSPGNVRVTLDYNIRTGLYCTDFLDPNCITVPAGDAPIILEVKWDAFLPEIIRDAVELSNRHAGAFSKYAACRIYG